MAITVVPSVITGQTYSAANFNTHIRDNINGIWVLTTAGDMLYATGSSAADRLALVPGGVMYGGASAPAWLATPSVTSLLQKAVGTGAPSWLARTALPGVLHTFGNNYSDTISDTTSQTYVSTSVEKTITLTVPCTIVAFAFATANKASGSFIGGIMVEIDGTQGQAPATVKSTTPTPISAISVKSGVAAGSRTCKLLYATANSTDAMQMSRGQIYALAFIEP